MILLILLILVTLVLLVSQRVRIEIVALLVISTLGLSGLLTPEEALSGFSSSATLTVAAMLVLSAGLERAGVVDYITSLLTRNTGTNPIRRLLSLLLPTALFSAFMNNTAIVALMIPVAITLGRKTRVPVSKLLLPISYTSILAGTATLIGTSTNILVDSLYRQAGGPGFHMFEFTGLGLIYLLAGGLYVVLVLPRRLPDRAALAQLVHDPAAGLYVTEVVVPARSRLIGRPLGELFGSKADVHILEIIRDEKLFVNVHSTFRLESQDTLIVEGTARAIHELLDRQLVAPGTVMAGSKQKPIDHLEHPIVEAVLTPSSHFLHMRVGDIDFGPYQAIQVLGVRRLGRQLLQNLRDFQLLSGDVLLLQGDRSALHNLQEAGEFLLIEGVGQTLTVPRKARMAVGILLAVVALATLNIAPVVFLAFCGVGAMLLTGCLTMAHAARAIDTMVIFLLAGMIPLGMAMEKTGLALLVAEAVVDSTRVWGPWALIGAFYLLTSILTELLSNNAVAVLLAPIALAVAAQTGIDPRPLLIAVTFGASASFATPIGYQTNTMVMGPGGYHFRDYLRVGLPLNILMLVIAAALIPVFWPLK